MTISIEEAQGRVSRVADIRRSKSLAGRQVLKQFEHGLESFNRAHDEARRSFRSRVDAVDEHGNINTEIVPGVPNGLRSGVCLIATNVRSVRLREQALIGAINKLEKVIQSINRGRWDEVPTDPAAYIESLWLTIPPAGDDELKVIAAPEEPPTDEPQSEQEKDTNAV